MFKPILSLLRYRNIWLRRPAAKRETLAERLYGRNTIVPLQRSNS